MEVDGGCGGSTVLLVSIGLDCWSTGGSGGDDDDDDDVMLRSIQLRHEHQWASICASSHARFDGIRRSKLMPRGGVRLWVSGGGGVCKLVLSKLRKCLSVSCMSNGVVSLREFKRKLRIASGLSRWNDCGIRTLKNGSLCPNESKTNKQKH